MVRARKELKCSECGKTYIKWQGICDGCGKAATLTESTLEKDSLGEQRRLRRRAKDSERSIAKRMIVADGIDPSFARLASSTGRVGHLTGLRFDAVSRTYVIENKNRKMPTWLIDAWLLLHQKGDEYNKHILLHVDPPNMPRDYPTQGTKKKLDTMAILQQTRHEQLIIKEKALGELEQILFSGISDEAKLEQARNIFNYVETKD